MQNKVKKQKTVAEEVAAFEFKEDIKIKVSIVIMVAAFVILFAFALICIFWAIYAWIKYGGTPITEIPAWALWFMFKNGGGN